jgi:hypothetical protein
MDILTLELFDVTVSQALTEAHRALEQHPGMPLRILLEGEEMVLHNLQRFLERQERKVTATPMGGLWQLDVAPIPRPAQTRPAEVLHALPASVLPHAQARPLILLRSAFAPGERALGRQLLLGALKTVTLPVPWVALAHEALELLEDPLAMEALASLKERGIPVRLSRASLSFLRKSPGAFDIIEDDEWLALAARGDATIL